MQQYIACSGAKKAMPLRNCVASTIKILVADSHQTQAQLMVSALRRRPEFSASFCSLDLDVILAALNSTPAHVAVVNLNGPKHDGRPMAMVRRLHLLYPQVDKILLLDAYAPDLVVEAFRSGVRGLYCSSENPFRMLCKCIHRVHSGEVWLNNQQMQYLIEANLQVPSLRVVDAGGLKLLTAREEQVVALVADGLANREIARELNLTENTVKKYLFRIFEKLGISTRVELVLYAVTNSKSRPAEWLAGA
jgi:DNA-binding NarL/FixJ family response regulator